jgi:uroporphyrinogen-III synthase
VGKKTAGLLEKNGFKVMASKPGSQDLAHYIIDHHPGEHFVYCCGTRRRKELPTLLREHGIRLTELIVYKTELNPQRIEGVFDGVLFFSPSGVESFFKANDLHGATAWCIGPTTERAAGKYTDRYYTATEPDTNILISHIIDNQKTAN